MPDLWNDRERAELVLREKRSVEREVAFFDETERLLSDAEVLLELAEAEQDAETAREGVERVAELEKRIEEAELRRMLSGEHDRLGAI